jgi:hypothetical protein
MSEIPSSRLHAYVQEFERLWRSRTPSTSIYDALPGTRVTFSDMNDWYFRTYGEYLSATARLEITPALRPVFRRLRREFPQEQW